MAAFVLSCDDGGEAVTGMSLFSHLWFTGRATREINLQRVGGLCSNPLSTRNKKLDYCNTSKKVAYIITRYEKVYE